MPGGTIQLASRGKGDELLYADAPQMTFFNAKYKKTSRFAMQKFNLPYIGNTTIHENEPTTYTFPVQRYAQLLTDAYFMIDLPHIWSPLFPPTQSQYQTMASTTTSIHDKWAPYEFRWIEYLGAAMISQVTITCGSQVLQQYSGAYLLASVMRDFSAEKKALFYEMIGHVDELIDPSNAMGRVNVYPNAFNLESLVTGATDSLLHTALQDPHYLRCEPSIRGRTLCVPLNPWFAMNTHNAFPLVCTPLAELQITVTLRPLSEWFQIRDVLDVDNQFPLVAPNFNNWSQQMQRFLHPPPDVELGPNSYNLADVSRTWNANVYLQCTYIFLDRDEMRIFTMQPRYYLIKTVREQIFYNVAGNHVVDLDVSGVQLCDLMFYFQRSDTNLRNTWTNYTNWPYPNQLPSNVVLAPTAGSYIVTVPTSTATVAIGPGVNPDGSLTGYMLTPVYNPQNTRDILLQLEILINGESREQTQAAVTYSHIEKYLRITGSGGGSGKPSNNGNTNVNCGIYMYHFGLHVDNNIVIQPSGALNLTAVDTLQLKFSTILPTLDAQAQTLALCNPATGVQIGVNKATWRLYEYSFNLVVFQERFNCLIVRDGMAALAYIL